MTDEALVRACKDGNDTALTDLLTRYRSLAEYCARGRFIKGQDHEDVVQEAMTGLLKSIRYFDLGSGVPFRAFAKLCIQRQILTAMKTALRRKHDALNQAILISHDAGGSGVEDLFVDLAPDPPTLLIAAEQLERARRCLLNDLTDLERDVLSLYLDGKSYEDIGARVGCHLKAIDNALQRVRRKLGRLAAQDAISEGPSSSKRSSRLDKEVDPVDASA